LFYPFKELISNLFSKFELFHLPFHSSLYSIQNLNLYKYSSQKFLDQLSLWNHLQTLKTMEILSAYLQTLKVVEILNADQFK